ncbi:MAG TPA: hypothetical protein VJB87_03310 [Candidatus Nanoarchaeia archaeon]|nr:hypothetical protein [Candidatus Nanoarchaeia archaeon]
MVLGEFATNIPNAVFIILHLLGLILAVIFAVRASHQIVPKTIVAAFTFWGIAELFYILYYIDLFTQPFGHLLGELSLFIAFILVMVGTAD